MGRLRSALARLLRRSTASSGGAATSQARGLLTTPVPKPPQRPAQRPPAAGATAPVSVAWAPETDGEPDPGEVVWGWVPFEEDPTQGKDRPVLLLGRDHGQWVGLMLSSRDHTRDPQREARYGRVWMDVGRGAWDRAGRESEVRLDRLLRLPDSVIRREGAALDRATFDRVVAAARQFHRFT